MPKNGSLYIHSSRGYTPLRRDQTGARRPGVGISAVAKNGSLTSVTGTSAAAASRPGSRSPGRLAARGKSQTPHDLLGTQKFPDPRAGRSRDLTYPNRSWGYGTLNVYGVFESLL